MRIGIVLGSTRAQRLGERVVRYIMDKAADVPDAAFEVLDLAAYGLPFFSEALPPTDSPGRRSHLPEGVGRWVDDVAAMDGYVFVVPEYNFEVPAAAKNALDLLAHEAEGKPAMIQSYSDTSYGGIVAGQMFRLPLSKLGMFPMPRSLPLPHAERLFDEDGVMVEHSEWGRIIDRYMTWALPELVRHAAALAPLYRSAPTLREVVTG